GERGNLLVILVVRRGMMAWLFPLALPDAVSRFDGLSVTFGYVRLRRIRLRRTPWWNSPVAGLRCGQNGVIKDSGRA
ncbi:MAG: hypothetical protein ACP5JH_11840, partial [Bacteroidota bacterium]